ncbi:MAG TPA: hypothetical protein PKG90_08740 [Chitinophagaceae bacterium]|nr:hypothetical protein [Chitinophagaceae bacterium]HNU13894.1 hypothetical protein [Chitinophagaceae bacterium]
MALSTGNHNVTSIKTDKVSEITLTGVRCFFTIAGNNMQKAGVCLNKTGDPTIPSKIDIPLTVPTVILNSATPKQFNVGVKGLTLNTTYYIRAYVKNNDGTVVYGNQLSFKTLSK